MTIRSKIITLFLFSLLVVIAYVVLLWMPKSENITVNVLTEATERELFSIGEVLVGPILKNEFGLVLESLKALEAERPNWVSLELVSVDGQRLYPIGNATGKQQASQLMLKHLIKFRHEPVATLTLIIDFKKELQTLNKQNIELLGTLLIGFFVSFLICMFFLDRLIRLPVKILSDAAKELASGNYSAALPAPSKDEIGFLVSSFQEMRENIQLAQKSIALEREVKNKLTYDLTIANEIAQVFDTANAPIFGIDVFGHVNKWNKKAATITGYEKEEIMHCDFVKELVVEKNQAAVYSVLNKALKGEETANYEFPLFGKTGEHVDVLLNSTTRRDATGKIVGVVGVGQDITELNKVRAEQEKERKAAAAQIIQASKLATLGEMATSVAHELNQPLNVIRMAAGNSRRRISKGTADIEYLNDKLERIESQTARAAAIIDHMRMFGREANEQLEPINPRAVVTNALDLMGEQLRLAGIEIMTEFSEDCPSILGHTIQLEQVILNLLANARDVMAESEGEKKITLRVFEDDKGVHIACEDAGGGIPEDVLPRIFEPFYTTKEMGKGTGLGLSVSYGIINDIKGTLVADNVDGGARFTITLPSVS